MTGNNQTEPDQLILASASPRRSELLALTGLEFRVAIADIPEQPEPDESAEAYVLRLAETKARTVASQVEGRWFIGADTTVVLGNQILEKPLDEADAIRILSTLSGQTHRVITAFALLDRQTDHCHSQAVKTEVVFKELSQKEIADYVKTGCPMDKAGAYAIQGGAAHFIREIRGSYTNVVGLPTCELMEMLHSAGVTTD